MFWQGSKFYIPLIGVTLAAQSTQAPEVASRDEATTFQSRVDLVLAPVVVRDSRGRVIGNLKKEDFQLFDRGKLQVITRFSIEKPGAAVAPPSKDASLEKAAGNDRPAPAAPGPVPDHYTAYVFDDVHIVFDDLVRVRDAALRQMDTLLPSDRAAIFTTSGQTTLDFTDDRQKLRDTLIQLRPRPIAAGMVDCPNVTHFMADAMVNKSDQQAMQAAILEAMGCLRLDPTKAQSLVLAQQAARSASQRALSSGSHETQIALGVLRQIIDRMSVMPGQRSMVLASPGFFVVNDARPMESEAIDRAVHANVVVSSLDARGLYVIDALGDISLPGIDPVAAGIKARYEHDGALANADVLAELASATGGSFFQNSNDLAAGFKKLAATPEFIYVLGFSPEKLKLDGAYHQLKIKLTNGEKFELQARRGYFAPKRLVSAEDAAKEQIRDELFSREELHNLPVDLHTQFFKSSDTSASVAVMARVVLKEMHFRKADGRNRNELTVVSALFDRNGNFMKAEQKIVTMRLKDDTLTKTPAITVKSEFEVAPGSYVVRLVVRDSEGQMMAAENGAVEIPY